MLKATARALAGERFEPIDPDALLGLGPLGLRAAGQRFADGGELVVEARPVIAPVDERLFCASCGAMGRRAGTVARLLAHAPACGRVTRLLVRVPRSACQLCRRVWRVDISSVAGPRSILTRSAAAWALEAVAVDNMAVSRVAARLEVGWDAANDAVLKAGIKALGPLEDRLTGARVIGIDEHVWRHRRGERCVTVIIDLTPARDGAGPARLVDMIPGRSKKALACWLADRPPAWRQQIEIVAMDGFTGYKTTTTEQLPDARAVMDPFHVVRLAADALDETRRRVQQATTGRRKRASDALYAARRTLLTRDSLLTEKQAGRLEALFADERNTAVEVTWAVHQKMIDAHRHPDPAAGRPVMSGLITSIATGVPAGIQEIARLGRTLKRRREDTPGLLRPPRLIQRPHRSHGRQARAPTRHRPRIAQPHPLHHPQPHPHRRPQTPTEHLTTPPNRKSHFSLELQGKNRVAFVSACFSQAAGATLRFQPGHVIDAERDGLHVARQPGLPLPHTCSAAWRGLVARRTGWLVSRVVSCFVVGV